MPPRNLECLFSALRKQKFVTFLLDLARQYKAHQISLDNLRDEQGNTLLHCIAENFNGIFQMSVESGGTLTPLLSLLGMTNPAILNSENSRGETPLHIAASRANLFFVHSFLTHGANPDACDEDGYLPVDLCPHPKGVAPEIYCARRLAICNLLLSAENFYNIHKISNKNFSPLYKAILLGAVKAVEAQLKKGASVNESFIWNADENALLFCLHSYRNFPKKTDKGSVTQIALRLLEEKIDLYATDPNGKTALYLAAEENLSLVCKAILIKDYRLMHVKTNEEESILPLLKPHWKTILPLEMPGVILEKRFQHGLSFFSILPNDLRNEIKNMLPTNETILLWILKDMADDEKWNSSCQGIFHQLLHTIQILRKALANLNPESTSGATQKIYQQVKLILQEQGGSSFLEDIFALEKKLKTNTQALRP